MTPTGFFYRSYERPYFWFEAIDMLRKVVLVAGLAILEPGSTTQLMLAQLVCLIFLALVLNLAPYKKDAVDKTNQVDLSAPTLRGVCVCARAVFTNDKSRVSPPPTSGRGMCASMRCYCFVVVVVRRYQATNLQIMVSLLMAMALKTNLPQPGTAESIFFGAPSSNIAPYCVFCLDSRLRACVRSAVHATLPADMDVDADALLSLSSGFIIFVGSYQLVTCVRKKIKTAAKMAKLRKAKSDENAPPAASNKNKAQVHPL